jgi:hypothetical protein
MRLGELIDTLDPMPADLPVRFDFGAAPEQFVSWRGHYRELSLTAGIGSRHGGPTAATLLAAARRADGGTFEGYKGGDYLMERTTPVWADPWGETYYRAITGLSIVRGEVVIGTFDIPAEYR